MFDEPKNLIVVYKEKNELILNLLKKLVETNDDNKEDGSIVGTKDGSVKIVSWTEKVWLAQKKAGTITDKILIIGSVKGVDTYMPIIDWKFNKWGIKYGWAGNTAVLNTDVFGVIKREDYNMFLNEFRRMALPEEKQDSIGKKTVKKSLITIAFGVLGLGLSFVIDLFHDKKKVSQQLYLYGIMDFYLNHLEEFMNA